MWQTECSFHFSGALWLQQVEFEAPETVENRSCQLHNIGKQSQNTNKAFKGFPRSKRDTLFWPGRVFLSKEDLRSQGHENSQAKYHLRAHPVI